MRTAAFAILLVLLCHPNQACASATDLQDELERFSSSPVSERLAFSVVFQPLLGPDSTRSRPDVSFAAEDPLVPASITKLVTAAAALELFGPRHTFQTKIAATEPLKAGVVDGDLVVIGGGDPFLVSERLWMLAHDLRQTGLERVTGDLILDGSLFPLHDPTAGASLGDSDRAYAARPSALAANFNALSLRIEVGSRAESPVRVSQDPYSTGYFEIENKLVTGRPGTAPDWRFDMYPTAAGRALSTRLAEGSTAADTTLSAGTDSTSIGAGRIETPLETARLTGSIPVGVRPFLAYRRANHPVIFSGLLLRSFLESAGIEIAGTTRLGAATKKTVELLDFPSRPLEELVGSMNRYSSNFIANQLALSLAIDTADPLYLTDAGHELANWLRRRFGAGSEIELYDGSGLSPKNRLTGEVLIRLLTEAWSDLGIGVKLAATFPGPGEDGTLQNRFDEERFPGNAPAMWAKTGTFRDGRVSSLAGYLQGHGADPVAFVLIMNGSSDPWNVQRMQELQESWIELYLR